MAYDFELGDCWPSLSERRQFWTGDGVPKHLRPWQQPDPRIVLTGDEGRLQYDTELAEWNEARLAWLRSQC